MLVAAAVALACVVASAQRLRYAMSATAYDLSRLVEALRGDAGARRAGAICAALEADPSSWERDVVVALAEPDERRRAAEVNEQLTELDHRIGRWARVSRVCASVSSSAGFLLAAVALRRGLVDPDALTGDTGALVTTGVVGQALGVVAFGLAGALGCAALQARGRRAAREQSVAADAFVERLETLVERRARSTS